MKKRKELIDNLLPNSKYGCYFRLVEIEDAEFIVGLRNDAKLSKYLSATSSRVEDQRTWIKNYKIRENSGEEFYIICLREDKETRLGINRLYNLHADRFEIGSWLFSSAAELGKAIVCDLFSRSIAFEVLNFEKCVFEVRKNNKSVLNYHKKFNPIITGEDELNYYFELDFQNFEHQKLKLLKFLQNE